MAILSVDKFTVKITVAFEKLSCSLYIRYDGRQIEVRTAKSPGDHEGGTTLEIMR
jgi:hypothetical protein